MSSLDEFEGMPVVESGAEFPSLAGGLKKAFAVDPRQDHQGEDVFVLIHATTQKVRHEPIDKDRPDGNQRRVHIYVPETLTFVSRSYAGEEIARQESAIEALEERQRAEKYADRNQMTVEQAIVDLAHEDGRHEQDPDPENCAKCLIGFDDSEAQALASEHLDGQHASGLREGCPLCDAEVDAEAAEAGQ